MRGGSEHLRCSNELTVGPAFANGVDSADATAVEPGADESTLEELGVAVFDVPKPLRAQIGAGDVDVELPATASTRDRVEPAAHREDDVGLRHRHHRVDVACLERLDEPD